MVLVDEVAPLTLHPGAGKLYLRFDTEDQPLRARVLTLLRRFPGNVPVVLHNPGTKKTQLVPKDMYVNEASALRDILNELLGKENVKQQ